MVILKLLAGFALLVFGADILVKGSSQLAKYFGISSLVIGLTIVAFGTSSPELVVSLTAAAKGSGDIALGNVIGSNIFNTFFILGISSLILPLLVARQLIRLDLPIMLVCTGGLFLVLLDGFLNRTEGLILLMCGIAYTIWTIREGKKDKGILQAAESGEKLKFSVFWILQIMGGLVLLVLGSRFIVDSSVSIARQLGLSELVIGLTIIAAGTSLPELATSVFASIKGEKDIAIGNIVGSNTFNILFILSSSAIVNKNALSISSDLIEYDLPVVVMSALLCLPLFITGNKLERWEGILFLVSYSTYLILLIINATDSHKLNMFNCAIFVFVIPLGIVFLFITIREIIFRYKLKNQE